MLSSSGKGGGKFPNAPCCDKGGSALAYPLLELLCPGCCKDGEVWEHDVSSAPLVESGVCSLRERVVLMLSGGQGHGFFLGTGEHLGGMGRCFGLQDESYYLLVRDRRKPLFSPSPAFPPSPT